MNEQKTSAKGDNKEVLDRIESQMEQTKPFVPVVDEQEYHTPPEKLPVVEKVGIAEQTSDRTKFTFPVGTEVFNHDGVIFRSTEPISAEAEGTFDEDALAANFVAGNRANLLSALKGKWTPQGNKIEKQKKAKA